MEKVLKIRNAGAGKLRRSWKASQLCARLALVVHVELNRVGVKFEVHDFFHLQF